MIIKYKLSIHLALRDVPVKVTFAIGKQTKYNATGIDQILWRTPIN